MEPVKIGLLGLGTVGGGTVTVLTRNAREIERRAGRGIEIARAAAREYRPESIAGIDQIGQIGDDAFAVVEDPQVQIVVELIGGYSPAKELVLRAIALGKHVVTANKALIARHGNEIFAAAREQGVMVGFEAAVAGGIPIIKALREGLAANHIEWIAGIINGTGNFILTEMRDKGRDFAEVLKEAQATGLRGGGPDLRRGGDRRRPQAHHPGLPGLRHPAPVRALLHGGDLADRAPGRGLRRRARLPHQAPRHRSAVRRGHRAAGPPDPDPPPAPHRQRGRGDERGAGEGGCRGPDPLLRGRGRRPADRLRGGGGPGGRGACPDHGPHQPGAPSRLPARRAATTRRSCPWTRWRPPTTCG